jgi:hypothetical protein
MPIQPTTVAAVERDTVITRTGYAERAIYRKDSGRDWASRIDPTLRFGKNSLRRPPLL